MMPRAGHSRAERLARALSGVEILPPALPVSCCLFQALRDWNATRDYQGQPPVENVATLAEILAVSLDQEGWCLSDLSAGHVRAFAFCDFDDLVEGRL